MDFFGFGRRATGILKRGKRKERLDPGRACAMEAKVPLLKELADDYVMLTNNDGELVNPASILKGKTLAFYFTSSTCVPCK